MVISRDLLQRARDGNRNALIEILSERYPALYRMAAALTGRDDAAEGVVKRVLRLSVDAARQWDQPADVHRWFMHHTLLTVRRVAYRPGDLSGDPLIRHVAGSSAYYPMFIEALRALPVQQREAFLLHHGERLDERGLGVAMDCSVQAAGQHFREATAVLRAYGGEMFPMLTGELVRAYDVLAPPNEMILPAVRSHLGGRRAVGRAVHVTAAVLQWAMLLLIGWVIWKIVPMLRY